MNADTGSVYTFGDYELDERVLELRLRGQVIELQPKPLQVLLHLIRHADRVVAHQELQDVVWPGVTVTEASLKTALYTVRRALGDRGDDPHWIATVPRFGYRFRGQVKRRDDLQRGAPAQARELETALAFVDREAELRTLRAALQRARQGERRIVLLHGAPGIGKTRTALELAREAGTAGFEVHIGRVEEGGGAPAYWPWMQILRSLARARSSERLRAVAAATGPDWLRLVPELTSSLAPALEHDRLDSEQARFRLLDAITQLLHDAAQERPLLLVLDDLHWADAASLALLAFVARNLPRAPLLAIGTHRELDGSLEPGRAQALSRIGRDINVESIALRGLERASIVRILQETLGAVDHDLVERVERATGGNPFFVSELARWLAEQAPGARRARIRVPERLREAVLLRAAERSPECQQLLRAASVIGTHFALPLLRRVLELSVDALLAALGEAERADLVRQEGPSGHYTFAHGVLREALYERLPDIERMRLHTAIGETLERLHAPDTRQICSELAHHFCESAALGSALRAIRYACEAAENASASFAHAEASALYRRALQAHELLDTPALELRCDLLIRRAQAQRVVRAALEPAQDLCAEAMRIARALERPDLLARAAEVGASDAHDRGWTLAVLQAPASDLVRDRYIEALEEALPRLAPEHVAIQRPALHALALLRCDGGERERANEILAEVLRLADENGDAVLTARALILLLSFRARLDGVEAERKRWTERVVEIGRLTRRPDFQLEALTVRAGLDLMQGDRTSVDATRDEVQRLARELRLPYARILETVLRCLYAQLDGRLEEAEREAFEAARVQARFQASPQWIGAILSMQLWWLALLRGKVSPLLPAMERESASFAPMHSSHLFIARLQCESGQADAAREHFERIAAALPTLPRDDPWVFCAALAGEICARLGDRERGAMLYEMLLPYAEVGTVVGSVVICTGSVARPLGSLAALLGRFAECEDLFEKALRHADRLRSPVLRACTELDHACALRGRTQSAARVKRRRLLDAALRRAEELGLDGVAEGARREIAATD